jgi:hypothetical protein
MSVLDNLDPKQLQALADKAGIDKDKILSVAQSMLPTLKDKLGGLIGGGSTPLFQDLMASPQFQAMFKSPEITAAAARTARETGVDQSAIEKLLPELGKLVGK